MEAIYILGRSYGWHTNLSGQLWSCHPSITNPHIFTSDQDRLQQRMKTLTVAQFNWTYYVHKYSDLSAFKAPTTAWSHWKKYGIPESRNPFDRRTLTQTSDINRVIMVMMCLAHASQQHPHYPHIVLIDKIKNVNWNDLPCDYKKMLSILKVGPTAVGYVINFRLYDYLFCELSFGQYTWEHIIQMYAQSYPEDISEVNVPTQVPLSPTPQSPPSHKLHKPPIPPNPKSPQSPIATNSNITSLPNIDIIKLKMSGIPSHQQKV